MHIDSYTFGSIVIDGKIYTSDVIIYPDRIDNSWRRKEGHELCITDLTGVMREKPLILVIGTGYSGMMRVLHDTAQYLKEQNIRLVVAKTEQTLPTVYRTSEYRKIDYRRVAFNLLKE